MKDECYLVLNKGDITVMFKKKLTLSSDQVAVKVKVVIGDKFFQRFIPETTITIPDSACKDPEISVELDNVEGD